MPYQCGIELSSCGVVLGVPFTLVFVFVAPGLGWLELLSVGAPGWE